MRRYLLINGNGKHAIIVSTRLKSRRIVETEKGNISAITGGLSRELEMSRLAM